MTRSRRRDEVIREIRAAYSAFNRGDFDAAVTALDPKIEWRDPLEFPGGRMHHGRDAVKRYLMQSRAGWAEGSSEPERFITVGDRIAVFVLARFRPRDTNEWCQTKLADSLHGTQGPFRGNEGLCRPSSSLVLDQCEDSE